MAIINTDTSIECQGIKLPDTGKIQFGAKEMSVTNTAMAVTHTVDPTVTNNVPGGDRAIQANITQNTSVALTGTLDGIYARATAGDTGGAGTVRGCEIGGRLADTTGNVAAVVTGGYFWADAKAQEATILRGVEVSLDGSAGGTSTTAQGVVIFNNSSATQTTSIGVDVNGGTPSGHKAFTYDIRLQNGETITNSTDAVIAISAAHVKVNSESVVLNTRHIVTTAEMNAGHTILAAVTGLKYRLIDWHITTVGGAAQATAAATGIGIYGTQSTSAVKLYNADLAALTENSVVTINTANTAVLAAGASFAQNDAASAITVKTVSAGAFDLITATHFHVNLTYALEA